MALVFTINKRWRSGKFVKVRGTVAFDSSYPTGGEDWASAGLGNKVQTLEVAPSKGYLFTPDYTNNKVMAYWSNLDGDVDGALVEVDSATDLSTVTAAPFLATLRY
jgi:hypothetical protein